ncbi:hypothetical protein RIR_jg24815.t3 [Rhizophagus irregularis DAOM 181602=DAOM 197198]|nr:hypothetical protein RIR_jg24815.t3 [Rhizophagus irregularis DAOM 181602=DAOM 197198]
MNSLLAKRKLSSENATTGSEPIGSIREFVILYMKVFRYSTSESEMRSILSMIGPLLLETNSSTSGISAWEQKCRQVCLFRQYIPFKGQGIMR